MILNISSLLSGEKSKLDIDYSLPVTAEGGAVNLSYVTFPSPAHVVGAITDNAGYMRLSLTVDLPYQTVCARCAKDVSGIFSVSFVRTVVPEGMVEDAEEKEEDFVVVSGGMLDIDEQLTEILEMEFPMQIFCKKDCKGLCPKCGADLNDGDCGCEKAYVNPAFADLLSKFEEK